MKCFDKTKKEKLVLICRKGNYKAAYEHYSQGLAVCPTNHEERVILHSNRSFKSKFQKRRNLSCKKKISVRICVHDLGINPDPKIQKNEHFK